MFREYKGTVYRPPVEASTFLIPVTEGCTHNFCKFCNMYKDVDFRMLELEQVENFLKAVRGKNAAYADIIKRVYLVGGDPFALSFKNLEQRILLIKKYLPSVNAITMYSRVSNIINKSSGELQALKAMGVDDLYVGIESGLDDVLIYMNKGHNAQDALTQCLRLNEAGIAHRDLLMPGAAGHGRGRENALKTAELLNKTKPNMVLLTALTAFEGTELAEDIKNNKFILSSEREILEEEKLLLENLDLPECYFWAAHSLDAIGVAGVIGEDRAEMLEALQYGIEHADEFNYNRTARRGTL